MPPRGGLQPMRLSRPPSSPAGVPLGAGMLMLLGCGAHLSPASSPHLPATSRLHRRPAPRRVGVAGMFVPVTSAWYPLLHSINLYGGLGTLRALCCRPRVRALSAHASRRPQASSRSTSPTTPKT